MTTLKDRNLKFLLMKTLADMVKGETDAERKELMAALLEQFEETGTKSFSIQIPGAEKVATFTIAEPKPGHKVNTEALLAWCEWNRPDLVQEVEHPAVEAWTERRLRDDVEKVITKEYKLAKDTYITDEGEPVDGVEYIPAGTPKSFTVTYAKDGQARVIEAYRAGELPNIAPGASLPQIGGTA
jgi:hypothetical protein